MVYGVKKPLMSNIFLLAIYWHLEFYSYIESSSWWKAIPMLDEFVFKFHKKFSLRNAIEGIWTLFGKELCWVTELEFVSRAPQTSIFTTSNFVWKLLWRIERCSMCAIISHALSRSLCNVSEGFDRRWNLFYIDADSYICESTTHESRNLVSTS